MKHYGTYDSSDSIATKKDIVNSGSNIFVSAFECKEQDIQIGSIIGDAFCQLGLMNVGDGYVPVIRAFQGIYTRPQYKYYRTWSTDSNGYSTSDYNQKNVYICHKGIMYGYDGDSFKELVFGKKYDYNDLSNGNIVVGKVVPLNAQPYLWYYCDRGRGIHISRKVLEEYTEQDIYVNGEDKRGFVIDKDSETNFVKIEYNKVGTPFIFRVAKTGDKYEIETRSIDFSQTYKTRCPSVFIENGRIVNRRSAEPINVPRTVDGVIQHYLKIHKTVQIRWWKRGRYLRNNPDGTERYLIRYAYNGKTPPNKRIIKYKVRAVAKKRWKSIFPYQGVFFVR